MAGRNLQYQYKHDTTVDVLLCCRDLSDVMSGLTRNMLDSTEDLVKAEQSFVPCPMYKCQCGLLQGYQDVAISAPAI